MSIYVSSDSSTNQYDSYGGFHKWGYPFIAGWFMLGKIPSFEMMTQETPYMTKRKAPYFEKHYQTIMMYFDDFPRACIPLPCQRLPCWCPDSIRMVPSSFFFFVGFVNPTIMISMALFHHWFGVMNPTIKKKHWLALISYHKFKLHQAIMRFPWHFHLFSIATSARGGLLQQWHSRAHGEELFRAGRLRAGGTKKRWNLYPSGDCDMKLV